MEKIDRINPFLSKIKERYPLTTSGSTKQTWHVVLDLKNSGIQFKVGDSIGIYPQNEPHLVENIIQKIGGNVDIIHPRSGKTLSLREFLTHSVNLTRLENVATLDDLYAQFSPLLPRFYSVASSLKEHPDEVHLIVALLENGVASNFLCHRAILGETPVPIYVQPSLHFALPQNASIPIIMIGPGTGVAPFRAFMQERHGMKNWLFFGERNRASDFFYKDFWEGHIDAGNLRLDLAFSRDQAEKHYVQHKLYEHSKELWKWVQEGAIIYVCGNADPMAKDVEATLQRIIKEQAGLHDDEVKSLLKTLRKSRRLLFDVY